MSGLHTTLMSSCILNVVISIKNRVTQVLWVKAGPTGSEVYRVLLELRVSEDVR